MTVAIRRVALTSLSPAGARARLLILTFHQVPAERDSLAPDVAPAREFELQMRWLREFCSVMPLPEAVERLRSGLLPARAAAITFDDGYRDNIEVAVPILEKLGLPATFFITAQAVENGIMWNDLVIEGVRRAAGTIDLEQHGLGNFELGDSETRRKAIGRILDEIKYRKTTERQELAECVFSSAGAMAVPRLMMTSSQVRELSVRGFDVGAHTVTHPILAKLDSESAQSEIETSGDWVEEVTGSRPTSFAYPNGRPGTDFSQEHERMVEQAGFTVAVSTQWGAAVRKHSQFALPRFCPWERDKRSYWLRLVKTLGSSYFGKD